MTCPNCSQLSILPTIQPVFDSSSTPRKKNRKSSGRDLAIAVGIALPLFIVAAVFVIHSGRRARHAPDGREAQPGMSAQKMDTKNPEQQVWLARSLYYGPNGVVNRPKEAEEWASKAAEQEYAPGIFMMGRIRSVDKTVPKERRMQEAAVWYEKAIRKGLLTGADSGGAVWKYYAGEACFLGCGTPVNHVEAAGWFAKAAESGDSFAMVSLGAFHQYGMEGIPQNEKTAFDWYSKAAATGDPEGIYQLALCHDQGRGVKKDQILGNRMLEELTKEGHTGAMIRLAENYESGVGVPADRNTCIQLLTLAAEAGNVQAMLNLAGRYETGNKVERDQDQEFKWLLRAAEAGNANAMNALSQIFCHMMKQEITSGQADGEKALSFSKQSAYWLRRADIAGDD